MTPNERHGGAAGAGGERDSRLDRAYRAGAREEPPAHLDAAILAAAHREAGARPRPLSAHLRAWRVPVSLAAVLMMSVSVVILVREKGGDQLDTSTALYSRSAKQAPGTSSDFAKTLDQAKDKQPSAREDAAPASEAVKKRAEDVVRGRPAESEILSRENARLAASALTGQSTASEPRTPMSAPAAPAPVPFPDASSSRESSPGPSTDSGAGASARGSSAEGSRSNSAEPASGAASAESKAAGQGGPMLQQRAKSRDFASPMAGDQPSVSSQAKPAPAPRVGSQAPARRALDDSRPAAPLIKELDGQPAEKWVEKIEGLRKGGRRAEADDLLAEFRRRFPDYPLPAALR